MHKEASKKPKKDYNIRKRYLAFEINSKNKMGDFGKIAGSIKLNTQYKLGQDSCHRSGIRVINKWNPELQRGIVRVNHKCINDIIQVLQTMDHINHDEVSIKTLGTAGILRKAVKKYLRLPKAS